MIEKRQRASSLSRTERPRDRRLSASELHTPSNGLSTKINAIDLRTYSQKLEDLYEQGKDATLTDEERLEQLVLIQVYNELEHGVDSLENVRSYLNLCDFYLKGKLNYAFQAKIHALAGRDILDRLKSERTDDDRRFIELSFEIYHRLIKCSLKALPFVVQSGKKAKNELLSRIDVQFLRHDLQKLERFFVRLDELDENRDLSRFERALFSVKFQIISSDPKSFDSSIDEVLEKNLRFENENRRIDLYLSAAAYLMNFDRKKQKLAIEYFDRALEIAEKQENQSIYAEILLKRSDAQVQSDLMTSKTEENFHQALKIFQKSSASMNKNTLRVIDAFARYYVKTERFQDALNILFETLPEKEKVFGEFSDEFIETESQIGAIYLTEGETLNAAQHLKTCFDLQEFVYGPKDSRTIQTKRALDVLKKDPMVLRSFLGRPQNFDQADRPAFRFSNRVSHEKEDLQWIQPVVTKKPPPGLRSARASSRV